MAHVDFGNLIVESELNFWKPVERVKSGVLVSSLPYVVAHCVLQLCLRDVPNNLENLKQSYSDPSASLVQPL